MSTPTTENVEQKVIELVCNQVDIPKEKISLDSHFIADIGFDSLDIVEFVMQVEDEFNISVSDEDSESIKTVGDAVKVIQKLIS